jgi:hypothetical protein
MFDLNAIVNAALTAAVQQAIAPLVEQITALEQRVATLSSQDVAMGGRIDALENIAAEFSPTVQPAVHIDEAKMVEALNSQEWFWEKLRGVADGLAAQAAADVTQELGLDGGEGEDGLAGDHHAEPWLFRR